MDKLETAKAYINDRPGHQGPAPGNERMKAAEQVGVRLEKLSSRLSGMVEAIEEKLNPVLRSSSPESQVNKSAEVDRATSPLFDGYMNLINRMVDRLDHLESVIGRLEV